MNLLYLEKFNNYYNRRVKYYNNVDEYISNSTSYSFNESVDFNPGDGVITTKVANLPTVNLNPDYLLAITEDTNEIASRWFIIDAKRERNGQYTITLKRDLIADYYEQIKISPMFVKKANLPADNPLIYNKEGIAVNQIKTSETLLKDETNTSWIVGYCTKDVAAEVKSGIKTTDIPVLESIDAEWDVLNNVGIARFPLSINLGSNVLIGNIDKSIGISLSNEFIPLSYFVGGKKDNYYPAFQSPYSYKSNEIANSWYLSSLSYIPAIQVGIQDYYDTNLPVIDVDDRNELRRLENQIVYSRETNRYYKLTYTESNKKYTKKVNNVNLQAVCKTITVDTKDNTDYEISIFDKGEYYITTEYKEYSIVLVPTEAPNAATLKITAGYNLLNDAPYAMFTMKNTPVNLDLATKLAADQTERIYDIQILPYCPVRDMINLETLKPLDGKGLVQDVDYSLITFADSEDVDYLYWAKTSSGAFIINSVITVPTEALELKVANECDMYRLVSPNYNGSFEFSAAKNLGVDSYDVVYTYKPYQPYIRVSPEFKGLYGQDFADARGLICNGNFSIATITDQWKSYEINNKNYENVFNAQIKTMDKNNALQLTSNIISSAAGAVGAGASIGALTGSTPAGIAMGIGSAVGGAADIAINQSIYQNNRQLKKDLFEMNLQTIQARPDTLNKVSAYSVDNKYFPFVEYYTCTDVEKEALRNKIKYEAMTVNIVSSLQEFIDESNEYNFFMATPILLTGLADDYHVAESIAVELEKGVYL